MIILLSHLGVALDQIVASYVPGIDVIVSGHDHYKFETPLTIMDPLGGTTLLVQARSNYMYAGKMKLEIDGDEVQLIDYQLIPLDESIPEEPTVKATVDGLIAGIEATYGPVFSQQMGYANAFFEEEATNLLELGAYDTPIGNLVTDAFRSTFATDIAIQPGGFTALPLWEGPLVAADVFRVNGYGFNTVNGLGFQMVTFDMFGESLLGGLEFGLSEIEKNDEFLIQVSGMQYFYDGTQPPFSRLTGVLINGLPVDPTALYSVTANEAVLQILDLLGIPYSNVQLYSGITEFQVLTDYIISQGGFIHPKHLGRILNIGNTQVQTMLAANGWLNSEAEFYLDNPTMSEKFFFRMNLKNNFGAVDGTVKLDLHKANFSFRSDYCEWLLIENTFATAVGKGKVNGVGNYSFLITAQSMTTGFESSNGKIKIVIWDMDDGERIVYDNLTPQNINGGAIVIKSFSGEKLVAEESNLSSPVEYSLTQNYPNPFNPSTIIKYSIPEAGNVQLKVYDIIGNEVATLVNEIKTPGSYEIQFNAAELSTGVYIYSLRAGNFVQTKKMILMK